MRDRIDDRSLKDSDVDPAPKISFLDFAGYKYSLFVPTKVGIKKSILDASEPLKNILRTSQLHNYDTQAVGEIKRLPIELLQPSGELSPTSISLYRPKTKSGVFTRFWINGLKDYAVGSAGKLNPGNLLALAIDARGLLVVNTSNDLAWWWLRHFIEKNIMRPSIPNNTPLIKPINPNTENNIPKAPKKERLPIPEEPIVPSSQNYEKILIQKLRLIAKKGYIKSITSGPTGVGATLEKQLEIPINSSKEPDFHGIEIKSKRTQKSKKPSGLQTLFSKTPDWKNSPYSAKDLLNDFGYMKSDVLQLYLTISAAKATNHHGFFLKVDESSDRLFCIHRTDNKEKELLEWSISSLITALEKKHKKTMWVSADTNVIEGIEHFHYYKATITEMGSFDHLTDLLRAGIITLDLTLKRKPSGTTRDHGYLFRVKSANLYSAIPEPREINL